MILELTAHSKVRATAETVEESAILLSLVGIKNVKKSNRYSQGYTCSQCGKFIATGGAFGMHRKMHRVHDKIVM